MNKEELKSEFAKAFPDTSVLFIRLELGPSEALILLGLLQLVLSHPDIPNAPFEIGRNLAASLESAFKDVAPSLSPFIEEGWDRSQVESQSSSTSH